MAAGSTDLTLDTAVDQLYLVGPGFGRKLKKLAITTMAGFFHHYPVRYADYSLIVPIASLQAGETVTIRCRIEAFRNQYTRKGMFIQKTTVSDSSGKIDVVWFNQPYLQKTLTQGSEINLSGRVDVFAGKMIMTQPEYEIRKPTAIHTGRLVPIYPETAGISSKWLRSRIAWLLKNYSSMLVDYLPPHFLKKYSLIPLHQAITQIHFPDTMEQLKLAKKRLSFDELLLIQLSSQIRRQSWKSEKVSHRLSIVKYKDNIQTFWQRLPFELTPAQKRAVSEIFRDLHSDRPMNRLLEGDVGSGKTVVAAIAMYLTCLNGFQSALMAPTEILAQQHFQTVSNLLAPLGLSIELRTGSLKTKASTQPAITIGTQALLNQTIKFNNLALVVIDEQQRFGVEQRALFRKKAVHPHLLTMTATPIPRTVALTLYGELELSYLDQLPAGRKLVKTWIIPEEKRAKAYAWIRKQNTQTFIICPLVAESESAISIKAATTEFNRLKQTVFPDLKLALLHGKTKTKEKDKTLTDFRRGLIDILVATPVVEVGIDIPNATIMVIEGAERFGLAQLHQLRGRVGRSDKNSYCLLFTSATTGANPERLKIIEKVNIGSKLAEYDLKIRGAGELFGFKQHGLVRLKIANIFDASLVLLVKTAVTDILTHDSSLAHYPHLKQMLQTSKIANVTQD